ncbi:MAG: KpsF/GutQ family sugar-phosphate isomerase [Gammaproteobacteria bacterium]
MLATTRHKPRIDLDFDFIATGKRVLKIEQLAIDKTARHLDNCFAQACQLVARCTGRVIVMGMGKSGHIGRKIAATLASTGTPSFFVHPAEAGHGDLGMITSKDLVIALSHSGNTEEIITILPPLKRLNVPVISFCGDPQSVLAQSADVAVNIAIDQEACPLGLAPTASTTVTLALGDALAIALLEARGFTTDDFAFSHPSGSLGRRLLLKVSDVMHSHDRLPLVTDTVTIKEALLEMTAKGLGMTIVVNDTGSIAGLYTDGDLRRSLNQNWDISTTPIKQVMTHNPKTISQNALAAEALHLMEKHIINGLVAVSEDNRPVGALNMQDLIRAQVV